MLEKLISKDEYREFTQRVDFAALKGVNIPHLVTKVGDEFKITLLEEYSKADLKKLDDITGTRYGI